MTPVTVMIERRRFGPTGRGVPIIGQGTWYGENDDRVPFSQGTMLYRVLDELGVDVTMIAYPRSTHQVREPKLRMDAMRRNVEFFEKALSPSRTTQSP